MKQPFAQIAVMVILLSLLTTTGFEFLPLLRLSENWTADLRIALLTPREAQNSDIVVVTVNEETLKQLPYRSPLDRRFLADLVSDLQAKGSRLVGLDILIDQPTEPVKDHLFKSTLINAKIPVVLATIDEEGGLNDWQQHYLEQFVRDLPHGLAYAVEDRIDGVVRSVYLGNLPEQGPGFVAALARQLNLDIPPAEVLPLSYRLGPDGKTEPYAVYPAHSVRFLPASWFNGKIVLIGVKLPHEDIHRTPMSAYPLHPDANLPGVFIHAHALAQLMDGRELHRPGHAARHWLIVLFAVLGILVAANRLGLLARLLLLITVVGLYWLLGFWLFHSAATMVPLLAPSLTFVAAISLRTALQWQRERAQKRFIRHAFSHYVDQGVIDNLHDHPEKLVLGGEAREMTFLFSDIERFVGLVETLDVNQLADLINEYMDHVCGIAIQHQGTIDKLIGDSVFVIFNAPLDQQDHAPQAVRCALALEGFTRDFMERKCAQGIPFGRTRIGVNTGTAVVGNFGGRERFDYTALGNPVNVAARLESANKIFGTSICVSESTHDKVKGITFRPLGEVLLVGKSVPVRLYEPLHEGSDAMLMLDEYRNCYNLTVAGDPGARSAFEALAQKCPQDALVKFYLSRLEKGVSGTEITVTSK